jgi:glucose/arabinose dehydrogenase
MFPLFRSIVMQTLCLLSLINPAFAQNFVPPGTALIKVIDGNIGSLALRHAGDGTGRLFVVQQNGAIRVLQNGAFLPDPFLNVDNSLQCEWNGSMVTPGILTGDERGLLGLAFHPQYGANKRFFINFTDGNGGHTVIAELRASASNANLADRSSCKILLRINQDAAIHNGGNVLFGPDGFLYIGMGDGGRLNDACYRPSTLTPFLLNGAGICAASNSFLASNGNPNSRALLGKMLRIDVNAGTPAGHTLCGVPASAAALYRAPASNAFITLGKCPETFAYGLRNPWRFSFDRLNGDLLIGDVAQSGPEEIDFHFADPDDGLLAGVNYGWSCFEGEQAFPSEAPQCNGLALSSTHDPVFSFPNAGGSSVVGGYRYRGPVSALQGLYFAADTGNATIFILRPDNLHSPGIVQFDWAAQAKTPVSLGVNDAFVPVSFGEDESGNVYVVDYFGAIYLITVEFIFRNSFE